MLRIFGLGLAGVLALLVLAAVGLVIYFPSERGSSPAIAPITEEERALTLAAMKPPKRARPVVAVVGANEGTETTDYLVPYGVLKRSGAADVLALGTAPGVMRLMPALAVVPDATLGEFDRRFPDGADYVIVPALHEPRNSVLIAWIKGQAARGATIVGICDGVLVLSQAGLLKERNATGHWLTIQGTQAANPTMRWIRDRRYVADRGLVTTTGVSASLPVSLALVETIAGRERAAAVAQELGVQSWEAQHNSAAFHLTRGDVLTMGRNLIAAQWKRDAIGIQVSDGVDLVALSFTADAYARTYRSRVVTLAAAPGTVKSDQGLAFVADAPRQTDLVVQASSERPAHALESALAGIAKRYDQQTANFVRLQLEERWR
jgi:putative intracellular protease/amidase